MNDLSPERHNKFRAYRQRKKAAGLREIRMWVLDVDAPGFQDELDDQIKRINASADEKVILNILDENIAEMWDKE